MVPIYSCNVIVDLFPCEHQKYQYDTFDRSEFHALSIQSECGATEQVAYIKLNFGNEKYRYESDKTQFSNIVKIQKYFKSDF